MKRISIVLFFVTVGVNLSAQCDGARKASAYARNANAREWQTNEYIITEDKSSQAGSIWYGNLLNLDADFSLEFEIYLGAKDGGADGLAFVLQRSVQGTSALSTGGGLGYKGISPAVAVEYDTWENSNYKDPFYDHIAIMKNGSVTHDATQPGSPVFMVSNLEDGKYHKTKITWQAATKTMKVSWDGKPQITQKIDMKAGVFGNDPGVYWGWTGATGDAFNEQKVKIINTTFSEILFAQGSVTNSTCNANGAIDLSVSGGTAPYSFVWSNGATNEDPNGLAPGTYSVTFTDACGNKGSAVFTVSGQAAGLPLLQCPADLNLDNTPGQCATVNVTFETPLAVNVCGNYRVAQTEGLAAGSTFPMGTTVNTFVLSMPDGKTTTCSFKVTVK